MNVVFFGMGSIGQRHYRIMQKLFPEFNYYAFKRSTQPGPVEIKPLYGWDEVERVKPGLAFICNPTSQHLPFALECARRRINLFIEKPLSDTLENVDELLHYVNLYQLKVLVGYNLRFHPVIEKIKEFMERTEERVLRFSAYCGSYLPAWRSKDYKNSYSAKRELGGGVILDLSHEIDYCRWLFGLPDEVIGCYGKYSALDIDVEDNLEVIFKYKDKVGVIHLDYYRVWPRREIEVLTESSVLSGDLIQGTFSIKTRRDERVENCVVSQDLTYERQLTHLFALLNGREKPRCSLTDSIVTMQLLQKIKGER